MRSEEPDPYLAATGFSVGGITPDPDGEEERELIDGEFDADDEIEAEEERSGD